jgi:lauroyl/myristoyl acyltransferase
MTLQILALQRPGRRWKPRIRLQGLNHLTDALEGGRGAVLWNSDFVYTPLIAKIALHQAAFPVVQLSRPEHGFSVSPFGVRFLNPIWAELEDRFLSERVVIEKDDASAALKTLRERLAANQVVSITVAETGRRTLDTKFLHGTLRVATGPVHLARTTGAPLLPTFAVRNEAGAYKVLIGPALPVDDRADPPYSTAIRAYAAQLEPFVRMYPDQWNGWIALGRLVENTPAFINSFDCAGAIARDLERIGLHPQAALG